MLRQLTSLDAQFLALETPRQAGHVAGLAILDPSTAPGGTLTLADLQRLLAERLPQLPPLRWRLAEVPLGLDYPYWVDDADFDLEYHVRELGLPAPGTDAQLAEQVARITSRPLDRARPLWELYLIHGLQSGHTAMLTKIHHAVIDGLSGAEIMGLLLDLSPEGREVPPPSADDGAAPATTGRGARPARDARPAGCSASRATRCASCARCRPRCPTSTTPAAPSGRSPARAPSSRVAGFAQGARPPRRRDARPRRSSRRRRRRSTAAISPHRRFAFGQLDLDEVKEVKNLHGCTVNDVVVSICAGAVRRWLIEHDELPDGPLVAQIPVSVRTDDADGDLRQPHPADERAALHRRAPTRVERLRRTHEALADMKDRHRALPAELLQDANHFIPPAVFARAARLTFRLSTAAPGARLEPRHLERPGPAVPALLRGRPPRRATTPCRSSPTGWA